jgi:short-subunit dehydrogenase
VLIVSSTASYQPLPYLNTYAATKVFDRFFAEGLAAEVARFGINVTALCPGPTASEFSQVANSSKIMPGTRQTAEEVASRGIAALAHGQRTIIPKFIWQLTALLTRFLTVGMITNMVEKHARPK